MMLLNYLLSWTQWAAKCGKNTVALEKMIGQATTAIRIETARARDDERQPPVSKGRRLELEEPDVSPVTASVEVPGV